MGFLQRLTGPDPDEERIRAYLAGGLLGPRTEWLAWGAVARIAETPAASPEQFGTVVTVRELAPVAELVRGSMAQDRDLSAWIARKSLVNLNALLGAAMDGGFASSFELGFAGMGLESPEGQGGVTFSAAAGADVPESDAEAARALADIVIMLMTVVAAPKDERPRLPGWGLFVDLYTGASGADVETTAYDITAWTGVLVARLLNTGRFTRDLPLLSQAMKDAATKGVPRLTVAGWYPNPPKQGEIVNGVPAFQRYWDGSGWTDRVRVRSGRDWTTGEYSLHDPPVD